MTPSSLLSFCDSRKAWLLDTIRTLVTIESPSDDKGAVDRCGRELAHRLDQVGAKVDVLPAETRGNHLLARFGRGNADGEQVLLLGHFDTVWPIGQLARMPCEVRDGRLFGPGVYDMKAGLAMAMLARMALAEAGDPAASRMVMLFTTDEEVGSGTSRAVIEDEARRSKAVFVLEPALRGGGLKTSRKGCGEFELRVTGVPAHAGVDPSKGVNAIVELAHQVLAITALRDFDRGLLVNVGLIGGGSRTNVVPEDARAQVDVRAMTMADAATLEASIRALSPVTPGARLEITGGFSRPPLERTAGTVALFEQAQAVGRQLGMELVEGHTGGGSDGNFTSAIGVPTLDGLGAVGDGAHALDEHVEVESLTQRAALLAGLISAIA